MAVGMGFNLDLLSGLRCGVSEGKIMCVNCVGLIFICFVSVLWHT